MITLEYPISPIAKRLFPGFFLGGFECSTPINAARERIDELTLTGHDEHIRSDYRRLTALGVHAVRDGVRWNKVDQAGKLDFSSVQPYIEAAESEGITVIWDLFHYGYPDDLDPFCEPFVERFCTYCYRFARMLVERGHGESARHASPFRFYTPVNEISFFAWAGGEAGIFAPHKQGRGAELKRRLAEAAICGIDAIRAADPAARIVNCDPLVRVVAPADAPWLEAEADYFNAHFVCEAWDMLAGRVAPELGGSPAHLDILGVNYYGLNQWEHQRPDNVLAEEDPRRMPFSEMLQDLYARYQTPLLVSETSATGEGRPYWLHFLTEQCLDAMVHGVDLHGLCIYPVIGMADWHTQAFHPMGLWDRDHESLRIPHTPTLEALRTLQTRMHSLPLHHRALHRRTGDLTVVG